jgi:hypothetical protein
MGRILYPLFALLASVTRQDLARQVAYFKEENRILCARLPERFGVDGSGEAVFWVNSRDFAIDSL